MTTKSVPDAALSLRKNDRRTFVRTGAVTAAGGLLGLASADSALANRNEDDSQSVDNLSKFARDTFADIRDHENAHVAFLVNALGASARPKPVFQNLQQSHVRMFVAVSQALENTGCGAYLGAAPAIMSSGYLAAAGSIALIEGRHAGWLNSLTKTPITQNVLGAQQNFETPLTASQVVSLAGPFIASLNGGPPLTYSTTPSASNDIAILNFALALEYLEAEFYNLNVRALLDI